MECNGNLAECRWEWNRVYWECRDRVERAFIWEFLMYFKRECNGVQWSCD